MYMYIVIKIKLLRVKGQLSPNGGQAPVATGLLITGLTVRWPDYTSHRQASCIERCVA